MEEWTFSSWEEAKIEALVKVANVLSALELSSAHYKDEAAFARFRNAYDALVKATLEYFKKVRINNNSEQIDQNLQQFDDEFRKRLGLKND